LNVTFDVSLLASLTKIPLGAGAASCTGNGFDSPGATVTPEASMIPDEPFTVTEAVALSTLGVAASAVITAEPRFLAVTGTATLVVFAPNDTLGGTVATFVLLDASVTVRPVAGAGDESVRVRFWMSVPVIVMLGGEKVRTPRTCTARVADVYPGADAVMLAAPKLIPVT
jgi:hypothetical protein